MQEFFNNLYNIENFTLYLAIIIGVLVIIFFVILFLGKKDQKLEQTRKLEKLAQTGFKEEDTSKKIEVKEIKKETVDILLPPPIKNEEPILNSSNVEVYDPVNDEELAKTRVISTTSELAVPNTLEINENVLEENPVDVTAEVTPISNHTENKVNFNLSEAISKVNDEKEEIKVKNEYVKNEVNVSYDDEIKLPEFDFSDVSVPVLKETKQEEIKLADENKFVSTPVFSSVYAPKTEDKPVLEDAADNLSFISRSNSDLNKTEIDLPKLKNDDVPASNVQSNNSEDFSLDSILGETYNINK